MSTGSQSDGDPGWRRIRKKKWYGEVWVLVVLGAAFTVGLGMVGLPKVMRAYDRLAATRAVGRAAEALAKGDHEHAMLDARAALKLNPHDAEAIRIGAQILEAAGAPTALEWRSRLGSLRPGDTENLIAWSRDALTAGSADTAADVLGRVKPEERGSAAYHDIAARLAFTRRDDAEAESHWKEAARLDPKEERYQRNLAVLQTKSGNPAVREEALEALRELAAKPDSARAAQLAILADATARGDTERAKEAAAALVAGPGATFQDRLTQLSVLRSTENGESSRLLVELRDGAAAKPAELSQLLTWMNDHDLALLVLDWLPELPPGVIAAPPVCMAVADARARGMDWKKLQAEVEAGTWGESEFARHAYHARALERLDLPTESEAAWQKAVSTTEGHQGRMEVLARQAFEWKWEERGTELLWKMTASGPAPRRVVEALWEEAIRKGDTEQMRTISKMQMKADPRSVTTRNNFAFLSLLKRSTDGGLHEMVDALYKDAPDVPGVVATYAFSMYLREKLADALAAMRKLAPEQLRDPTVARYHAILLAAAGRGAEAAEFLALGEKGFLLPEEKALLDKARAATSGGSNAYLRQLNDAAASPKPEDLPKLIAWMTAHDLAGLVSSWSLELAPEIGSRPEVRVAVAEAHGKAQDWQRLRAMTESGPWAELDFLRSAYFSRAMRLLKDDAAAETAWKKAVADATEKGSGALERLARVAQGFGWQEQTEEVLWQLALKPGCPRWAADSLWRSSLAHGTAAQLAKSSRLLAETDPRHVRTRDCDIAAAMLTHTNESAVWKFASALHAAAPADVVLTLIHALALHKQGKAAEAKALVGTLDPDALQEPRSALFHGVFLAASSHPAEAAKSFEVDGIRTLPIEERALIGKTKTAVQGGPEKPGGK